MDKKVQDSNITKYRTSRKRFRLLMIGSAGLISVLGGIALYNDHKKNSEQASRDMNPRVEHQIHRTLNENDLVIKAEFKQRQAAMPAILARDIEKKLLTLLAQPNLRTGLAQKQIERIFAVKLTKITDSPNYMFESKDLRIFRYVAGEYYFNSFSNIHRNTERLGNQPAQPVHTKNKEYGFILAWQGDGRIVPIENCIDSIKLIESLNQLGWVSEGKPETDDGRYGLILHRNNSEKIEIGYYPRYDCVLFIEVTNNKQ